jgi:hypothetical protein
MVLRSIRARLEQFREDMISRSIKEYSMIAPDNRKSTITAEQLDELIQKLPQRET